MTSQEKLSVIHQYWIEIYLDGLSPTVDVALSKMNQSKAIGDALIMHRYMCIEQGLEVEV